MKPKYFFRDRQGVVTGPLTADQLLTLGSFDGCRCSVDRQNWSDAEMMVQRLRCQSPETRPSAENPARPPFPQIRRKGIRDREFFAAALRQLWNPAAADRMLRFCPFGKKLKMSLFCLLAGFAAVLLECFFFARPLGCRPETLLFAVAVTGVVFLLAALAAACADRSRRGAALAVVRLSGCYFCAAALAIAPAPGVICCTGWLRGVWLLMQMLIWGWFCRNAATVLVPLSDEPPSGGTGLQSERK